METEYKKIAHQISRAAEVASKTPKNPEAKLRELVAPIFRDYLVSNQLDLNFEQRDELVLANGRPDSVYNRLILEYKKPGVIKPNNAKNRDVISRVQGYIEDYAQKEGWKKERLLGVAFDGWMFLFIRKARRWIYQEPVPVTPESIEYFFQNLTKLTGGNPLLPEYLIRDFAVAESSGSVATKAIKAFYFALTTNVDLKVNVFFKQWAVQFSDVHGAIENKKFDTETLFKTYGFTKDEQKNFSYLAFFFALDTYYSLFMKLLAFQVVGYYTMGAMVGPPLTDWEKLDSLSLKGKLKQVEDGGIFRDLGISNFLEGDLLSWYLNDWNTSIEEAVREMIKRLNGYDPQTMELFPDETRDILKKIYQFLVPKQIRHDLGEYYTPDWLAERCLNQVGYGVKEKDLLKKRLLDPGCGSGTFLILAIKRAKENATLKGIESAKTLDLMTRNIVGFDLNPLAVISARTNYLLAVSDLLKYKKQDIIIPVYLCDSINPPQARIADEMTLFEKKQPYEVKTAVGNFLFSHTIVSKQRIQQLANLLEKGVKNNLSSDAFQKEVQKELELSEQEMQEASLYLADAYDSLVDLERQGINGIWSRIIKNAFAPYFVGKFDFVVGNPPWVNWESLPQDYRDETKKLWMEYGLFSLSGHEARLGGGKKDISMLMMYVAIDKYLRDKHKLCFVITQTLFKTQGAGDGFRRFRLGENGQHFRIDQLDDMVELQPFEGATNRTAVVLCTKGEKTKYPLSYTLWRKNTKGKIELDNTFEETVEATIRSNLKAQPVGESETSPWISARAKALRAIQKGIGQAAYSASAGSTTWLNGVYWGTVGPSKSGLIKFCNLHDEGKIKIEAVEEEIEPTLVYPLLRGRDVKRWKSTPNSFIIVSQNPKERTGYELKWMEKHVPKTLAYFNRFKDRLLNRSGYKKYLDGEPFYSIYNVSEKTFNPFKVVWSEVNNNVEAAVVSSQESDHLGKKVVIPDHTVIAISLENEDDANYVCAMLNSSPSQFIVTGYVVLHPSPHILKNIKIPKYDPDNELHQDLIRLSKQCHEKVAIGITVSDLEDQIDELAAELWGLSKEELKEIKASLEEMR
ncbi:MAG: N-6 DNA methylase [Ignavibacteriae bacterium]|nr:N-6 DNA methylase [Ignavibacteriota bacterium]